MKERRERRTSLETKKEWNGMEEMNQGTMCRNDKQISSHAPIPINWQQRPGMLCAGLQGLVQVQEGGRSGSMAYNYLSSQGVHGNQMVWASGISGRRTTEGSNYRPLFKFRNETKRNEVEKL